MGANSEHLTHFDPAAIERPDESLLTYYGVVSLFALIAAPIVFAVHFCKYLTLRYRFDDEGVSMAWGVLFRREINLTYRRIQDIHVTRNIVQRWFNLASVSVQTASGSAAPEMTIEGVRDYEALRDFLYTKMRGARGHADGHAQGHIEVAASAFAPHAPPHDDEALILLRQIARDLGAIRQNAPRQEERS